MTVPWLRAYQEKHGDTPTICGTLGSVLILLKQEEEEAAALLLRCQAESCESIDVGVASLFLALYHRRRGEQALAKEFASRAAKHWPEEWVLNRLRAWFPDNFGQRTSAQGA